MGCVSNWLCTMMPISWHLVPWLGQNSRSNRFWKSISRTFQFQVDPINLTILTLNKTVTSNVLGLVVAANLSDTTYGWHGYVTGMSLYYYHWSQIPMERQQLMLTSDMVLATSLGMRKTALLGNPYTPCSRSETHYQCDLQ